MLVHYKLESLLRLYLLVTLLHFFVFEKGAFQANEAWKWRVLAFTKHRMILEEEEMALPLHSVKTTVIHHRDTTRSISPLHLWKQYDETVQDCSLGGGGGGGVTQQMFIRGGSTPRSNPLPFYIPFFTKRYPFRIPSMDKWYPFHLPILELCIPFNCCKCTDF